MSAIQFPFPLLGSTNCTFDTMVVHETLWPQFCQLHPRKDSKMSKRLMTKVEELMSSDNSRGLGNISAQKKHIQNNDSDNKTSWEIF